MKPEHWRLRHANDRLIGYRCRSCDWVGFPEKRRTCKRCRAAPAEFDEIQLSPYGKVLSYVIQYRLPAEFESPLALAVVELEDGARLYGHLVDVTPEELCVGLEVEADFRVMFEDDGLNVYSYKFRPRRAVHEKIS